MMYSVDVDKYLKNKTHQSDSFAIETAKEFDQRLQAVRELYADNEVSGNELQHRLQSLDESICIITLMHQGQDGVFSNVGNYVAFILDDDQGNSKIIELLKGLNINPK